MTYFRPRLPSGDFYSTFRAVKFFTVQKDRFHAILADLNQITDEDIKSLNQLRRQYPYFQNQYVMIAKALKDREHPKLNAFLKKAAIYVADRSLLKGIVTGEHDFSAPLNSVQKNRQTATSAESTANNNQEMIKELEKDLKENKEKKRLWAKKLEQDELKAKSETAQAVRKTKKNQSQLIEKFIQNEPQIKKQKSDSEEKSQEQADLCSKNGKQFDEFYTETLARLMVRQKKRKKAIEIYEKLMLKFPEKRAYFASQIEDIK